MLVIIYQVAHIRQEVRSRQPQVGENTLQKNTSYIYHTILSQNASIQILALADNACLQSTAHQETRDFDLVTLGPPSKILEDELRLEVKLSHEQLYHLPHCPLLILLLHQTKLSPLLFFRNQRWAQFCVCLLLFSLNYFLFPRNKLCISWQQVFKASKLLLGDTVPIINIFPANVGDPSQTRVTT